MELFKKCSNQGKAKMRPKLLASISQVDEFNKCDAFFTKRKAGRNT